MKFKEKRLTIQKTTWMLASFALCNAAHADVKYTTVSSFAQEGKMTPQTTTVTWMKEGLKRIDTFQKLGPVVIESRVVMNAPKRQIMHYCDATKMYHVAVLGPDGSPLGSDATSSTRTAAGRAKPAKPAGKPKTGAIVVTTKIQSLGLKKLLARSARHYILNATTELSGCAGNSKTKSKSEVWMADIVLPLFKIPGESSLKNIEDAYIDDEGDCFPTFKHICDVATYNRATSGLVIKSIMYDEGGKAVGQTEITALSSAKLAESVFALPAGYKKVTRPEYDKAFGALMTNAYISKFSDIDANADADTNDDANANTSMGKFVMPVEDKPADTKDAIEVAAPFAAPTSSTRYVAVPLKNDAKLDKSLVNAAKDGKDAEAIALLQSGANPNTADKNNMTPLLFASQNGKPELVRALLDMGANANAVDKNGRSALHFATMIGQPKPKKKGFGGLGKMLGGAVLGNAMGGGLGGGLGNLGSGGAWASALLGGGSLDALLGQNLSGLLNGGAFNLGNKNGWTAIIGTALQGDLKNNGAFGMQSLLSGGRMDAGGWINLVGAVKGSNLQVLAAMSNVGGAGNAQWAQFINAAASSDKNAAASMMSDSKMQPLLVQATQGFATASGELPANAAKTIVADLLAKGATANLADNDGKTPSQMAQARSWNDVAALLQK